MELSLIIASVLIGIVIGGENQTGSSLCEKRYQQHYAALNCTPVYGNDPKCPSLYKCPEAEKNVTGCLYNGRIYKDGEHIDTGNQCKTCLCFQGFSAADYQLSCLSTECFNDYEYDLSDNCYKTYEAGKCCSTGTKCLTEEEKKKNTCDYSRITFHYGQKIYPKEDPCQTCLCNADWSGVGGKSCSPIDCTVGIHRKEIQEGCLPIYHKNRCCPIQYYCEMYENGYKNTTKPLATQEDIQSGKSCEFNGENYKIGQDLTINLSGRCATCTCQIPPILTCILNESCK